MLKMQIVERGIYLNLPHKRARASDPVLDAISSIRDALAILTVSAS